MRAAKRRKKSKAKKRKIDSKTVMSMLLIFLMVASAVALYFGSSGENKMRDSGHVFLGTQEGWRLNNKNYYFNFLPSEVADINITGNAIQIMRQTPMVYITTNTSSESISEIALAQYKLTEFLFSENIYVEHGALGDNDTLPKIDCSNATVYVPVILFEISKISNQTLISENDGCIRLSGKTVRDLFRTLDRFMFTLLEVIQQDEGKET